MEVKWIQLLKEKIREKKGSGLMEAVILFLVTMMFFSVAFEYLRIQMVANNIRDAYERAILTVASENYNEVYAGFREEDFIGGVYEGGSGGGGKLGELPEWISLNDYGSVGEELEELLVLKRDDGGYTSDKDKYTLRDIEVQVKEGGASTSGKYEVKGEITMEIPIYFASVKITQAEIPLKVKTAYTPKH